MMTHRAADSGSKKMAWLKGSLLLGASVSMLTIMAPAALAQDSGEDVVIATGIRQTLENALGEKREADSLIEVILAEDIGKLPDQNLAEVLENITGIQITRTAGVGTGVQIRGTNDNRTEINGVSTVGAGTGRGGISFEDVSASIIAGLEVIKAPEAETIEGSVGGTINLRTIRPLDLDKTLASFRVQGEYSDLSESTSPRLSGSLGKKWENASGQEIGVVLSGSYTEQEATSFRPRVDRDTLITSAVTADGAPGPDFPFLGIQFLNQEVENFEFENINFAGSVEARPTPELKLFFDAIVNDQERAQDSLRIQGSGVSSVRFNNVPDAFETVDFGSLDGQDLGSIEAALTGTIQPNLGVDDDDPNLRFSSDTGARVTTSEIYRGGAEWEVGDNLTLGVEYATSTSDTRSPNLSTTLNFINPNPLTPLDGTSNDNSVPFIFDLSDGNLAFGIDFNSPFAPSVADLTNPANVVLDAVTVGDDTVENSEDAFRVDATYDLADSGFGSFANGFFKSVGVGYRYNDTSSQFNDVGSSFSTGAIANSPNGLLFEELLVEGPDNIEDSADRGLAFTDFLLIDPDRAFNDPDGTLDILQAALNTTNGSVGDPVASQSAFFDIEEETHAIYGQLGFEYGILKGNAGLRWVDTDITSTGNQEINDVFSAIVSEGSYNELLPRVNLALTPHEDFLIRASWSEDINRPDFSDLNTSVSFPTGPNNAVEIGNPLLLPESVTSYDISADWYFAPSAVLSVGFFHKDRGGVFVTQEQAAPVDTNGFRSIDPSCPGGGIFNPVPDRNVLSDIDGNGLCVPIETTFNDTGTTTQTGVEVAFQYDLSDWEDRLGGFDWASGFGLLANYTYQDFGGGELTQLSTGSTRAPAIFAQTTGGDGIIEARQGLLDNSENAFNITGYYEKFGLSARLRYTWRDSFRTLDTAAGASLGSTLGFPVVTASRGQLNGSINYDVTDNFTVGVEGVNLTTSNIEQFCVNDGALLCFQGIPDRRITFGGSYTF